jgi:hypothetical protein
MIADCRSSRRENPFPRTRCALQRMMSVLHGGAIVSRPSAKMRTTRRCSRLGNKSG